LGIRYNKVENRRTGALRAIFDRQKGLTMEKQQAWDYSLGIIKVDGLAQSPEFLAMAEKEKCGEMTLRP
jgi:hypothetical protein